MLIVLNLGTSDSCSLQGPVQAYTGTAVPGHWQHSTFFQNVCMYTSDFGVLRKYTSQSNYLLFSLCLN
jgi:hypothetical protein